MTKITVYTCLVGGYSDLCPPPAGLLADYEFIVISDEPISIAGWQLKLVEFPSQESNRRKAKKPKIQPWKYIDTDISVWVDANMVIRPEKFKEALAVFLSSEKNIGLFRHNKRKNLDAEFNDVIARLKDDTKLLSRQRNTYKKLANYDKLPLYQGGVIFRRHECLDLETAMQDWQSEIDDFSARDQVSLPVILAPIAENHLFVFPSMLTNDIVQTSPHLKYENEPGSRPLRENIRWWIIKATYRILTSRIVEKIKKRIRKAV